MSTQAKEIGQLSRVDSMATDNKNTSNGNREDGGGNPSKGKKTAHDSDLTDCTSLNSDSNSDSEQEGRTQHNLEEFIGMWKKICRLRRKLPVDIIGRLNHLAYDETPHIRIGQEEFPDIIWAPNFCKRLTQLALGGPWGNDMNLLAMFLRYAVACRINDRRSMPLIFGIFGIVDDNGEFLREMNNKLGQGRDQAKPIPTIHHEVRVALRSKGLSLDWHSKLFRNLEVLAYNPSTTPFYDNSFQDYRVTTKDLHNVMLGVANCRDLGISVFRSIHDTAAIMSASTTWDGYPKTLEDVKALLEAHHVSTERALRVTELNRIHSSVSPTDLSHAQTEDTRTHKE